MTTIHSIIIEAITATKKSVDSHITYSKMPGIYAFVLSKNSDLGKFGKAGQIIYVGKAEDCLAKRDLNTHFKDGKTGSSTLRRSLGAILKAQLGLKAVSRNGTLKQTAINNYKFDIEGEKELTLWMKQNLEIGYWEYSRDFRTQMLRDIEKEMTIYLQPTLDLDRRTKKYNPLAEMLDELRKMCKKEAKHNAAWLVHKHTELYEAK